MSKSKSFTRRSFSEGGPKFPILPSVILALIIAFLSFFGGISFRNRQFAKETQQQQANKFPSQATVTKVIDADTLEIQDGRSLRLTAVNAPDAGPPAKQANEFTAQKLINQTVTLEYEKNYEQDRFGRLNAYVFVNSQNFNIELVKNGLAEVVIYDKRRPWKYQEELLAAQDRAKKQKLGIWSTSLE
jgi:micrococcal nuclease